MVNTVWIREWMNRRRKEKETEPMIGELVMVYYMSIWLLEIILLL